MHRKSPTPVGVATRFAKDEDGAVMVLTAILLLLLVKVAMSTYNVGVMTVEKTRLQMTSDAAAYSSAVWQARFLNHCAYTRRAIIANNALIAYITAMEANKNFINTYKDEEIHCVNCPGDGGGMGGMSQEDMELMNELGLDDEMNEMIMDEIENNSGDTSFSGDEYWEAPGVVDPDSWPGPPRISVDVLDPLYEASWALLTTLSDARDIANNLNTLYALSQDDVYFFAARPWYTVVPHIVEEANKPRGSYTPLQITIDPGFTEWADEAFSSNTAGMLNDHYLRKEPFSYFADDIKARMDTFTDPEVDVRVLGGSQWILASPVAITDPLIPPTIPFVAARPYWAVDPVTWALTSAWTSFSIVCIANAGPERRVTHIVTGTKPMTMNYSTGVSQTQDYNAGGKYYLGFQTVWIYPLVSVPIFTPVSDPGPWVGKFDRLLTDDDLELFEINDVEPSAMEPSVYSALRIERSELVSSGTPGQPGFKQGKLFHNIGIPLAQDVIPLIAVSRAKVTFQPTWSGTDSYKPSLYYPIWEARLAPIYGDRRGTSALLQTNADSLFGKLQESGGLDTTNATLLNRVRY